MTAMLSGIEIRRGKLIRQLPPSLGLILRALRLRASARKSKSYVTSKPKAVWASLAASAIFSSSRMTAILISEVEII